MSEGEPEFTCPVCGSHFYGSNPPDGGSLRDPIETLIGYCKGDAIRDFKGQPIYKAGYLGCSFTWPRADDEKYGLTNHGTPS